MEVLTRAAQQQQVDTGRRCRERCHDAGLQHAACTCASRVGRPLPSSSIEYVADHDHELSAAVPSLEFLSSSAPHADPSCNNA